MINPAYCLTGEKSRDSSARFVLTTAATALLLYSKALIKNWPIMLAFVDHRPLLPIPEGMSSKNLMLVKRCFRGNVLRRNWYADDLAKPTAFVAEARCQITQYVAGIVAELGSGNIPRIDLLRFAMGRDDVYVRLVAGELADFVKRCALSLLQLTCKGKAHHWIGQDILSRYARLCWPSVDAENNTLPSCPSRSYAAHPLTGQARRQGCHPQTDQHPGQGCVLG